MQLCRNNNSMTTTKLNSSEKQCKKCIRNLRQYLHVQNGSYWYIKVLDARYCMIKLYLRVSEVNIFELFCCFSGSQSLKESTYRFPLSAWSSSMHWKSALEFPAPKPWWLFLWMNSMNTVGRSCSGFVKI